MALGVDSRGYILKQGGKRRIRSPYTKAVSSLVARCDAAIRDQIDSIYVYGGVARGTAVPGKSDLDVTLVVNDDGLTNRGRAFVGSLALDIVKEYPFLTRVDLPTCTRSAVLDKANLYSWGFWIKVICVCVHGTDLGKSLPRFRPTWDLAFGLHGNITRRVPEMRASVARATDTDRLLFTCRCVARNLLRAAFCLVMPTARVWTDDPVVSAKLFAREYPQHKKSAMLAAQWATDPTDDRCAVLRVIDDLGVRVASEYRDRMAARRTSRMHATACSRA